MDCLNNHWGNLPVIEKNLTPKEFEYQYMQTPRPKTLTDALEAERGVDPMTLAPRQHAPGMRPAFRLKL